MRWGERAHTRPLAESDLERPEEREPSEERIADDSERAVLHEIVAELPQRRQAVVKLRFFFDREPAEVQALLGISSRTYRLEVERALRHIADRYQVAREGRWCEDRRSLILAFVAGVAGPGKILEARRHLGACPGCAHMAAELRQAAEKVAVVAPVPDRALVALDSPADLTTPTGEAMAGVLAVFAQLERRLIGERTRAALAQRREALWHLWPA